MIRLSWLQFRAQAVTAAAAVAAVAVILAIAGPHPVFTGTDGFLYSAASGSVTPSSAAADARSRRRPVQW